MPPKGTKDPAPKAGSSKTAAKDKSEASASKSDDKGKAKATKTAKRVISNQAKAVAENPPIADSKDDANHYEATKDLYLDIDIDINEDGSQDLVKDLALLKIFPLDAPDWADKHKHGGYDKLIERLQKYSAFQVEFLIGEGVDDVSRVREAQQDDLVKAWKKKIGDNETTETKHETYGAWSTRRTRDMQFLREILKVEQREGEDDGESEARAA